MKLKFWQRKSVSSNGAGSKALPKPKELPQAVGRYLVVDMGKDPDWVWSLRMAYQHQEGHKSRIIFRLYDPARAQMSAVAVRNYDSLSEHPELILYTGSYDKEMGKVVIDQTEKE